MSSKKTRNRFHCCICKKSLKNRKMAGFFISKDSPICSDCMSGYKNDIKKDRRARRINCIMGFAVGVLLTLLAFFSSGCSVDVVETEVEINQEVIIFAVRQHVALVGIGEAMQSGQNQEEAMLEAYTLIEEFERNLVQ